MASSASNREFLFCFKQVTEPLYEAKTDVQINSLDHGGSGASIRQTVYPISEKQAFFNSIATATVIKNDDSGKFETLVTITDEDIAGMGS